jgi:hypothetical protein
MRTVHWILLGLVCAGTIVAEAMDGFALFPAFYGIFGFVGCLLFLFLAKVVGKKLIMRKEDFYDDR